MRHDVNMDGDHLYREMKNYKVIDGMLFKRRKDYAFLAFVCTAFAIVVIVLVAMLK